MKYWVYMNGEVPGSYEAAELAAMPGFGEGSMVCPVEGEAGERRWRRAGQHEDLVEALRLAVRRPPRPVPPEPPIDAGEPAQPRSPDEVLNDASARIFSHVSELMKELANRREERALTQALQRQIVELKNELMALRERNQYLSDRAELIPGFEDRERKLQEAVTRLRAEVQEAERCGLEASRRIETLRREGEAARADAASLSEDLKRQTALADELTRQLAEKETSLAKAFAIIRKLEQQLGQILPETVSGIRREVPVLGETSAPAARPPEPPAPAPEPRGDPSLPRGATREEDGRATPPAPAFTAPAPLARSALYSDTPLSPAGGEGNGLVSAGMGEGGSQVPPVPPRGPALTPRGDARGEQPRDAATEPAPEAPAPSAEAFDAAPPAERELAPEPVTPIPAPWQSKLDRTLSYFKVLLLGSPRRAHQPPPAPGPEQEPPSEN